MLNNPQRFQLSGRFPDGRRSGGISGGYWRIGILHAGLSLAVSAMFILLMSGMILFQTSEIIHGGETNYILATVSLYISIYNLFLSLLQLLGVFSDKD